MRRAIFLGDFYFFLVLAPWLLAIGFWLFLSVACGGIFGMSNLHTFQYTSLIPLYLYLNLILLPISTTKCYDLGPGK